MFNHVKYGEVSNLRLTNGHINATKNACALAGYSNNAKFKHIQINNTQITAHHNKPGNSAVAFNYFRESESKELAIVNWQISNRR